MKENPVRKEKKIPPQKSGGFRKSDRMYKSLFRNAADAVLVLENDCFIECNQSALDMFGCEKKDLIGAHPWEFSPEKQLCGNNSVIKAKEKIEAVLNGEAQFFEWVHSRKNGSLFNAEITLNKIDMDKKTIIQATVRDITERKKAEETLILRDRIRQAVNFAAERFLGLSSWEEGTPEVIEKVGLSAGVSRVYIYKNSIDENDIAVSNILFDWAAESIKPISSESGLATLQIDKPEMKFLAERMEKGKIVAISCNSSEKEQIQLVNNLGIKSIACFPIFVESEWWGFIGIDEYTKSRAWSDTLLDSLQTASDIFGYVIARQKSARALDSEKELLAVTLSSIGDGVISTDSEGRVMLMNGAAEKLTGVSLIEAYGKPINEVLLTLEIETDRSLFSDLVEVSHLNIEVRIKPHQRFGVLADVSKTLVSLTCAPILDESGCTTGTVFAFKDITDQKKIEQELLRSEKLESVGVLAGGIAHDFNNILTAIISSIALAKLKISAESDLHNILVDTEKAAFRAKHLTQQLLTFSKGGAPVTRSVSVSELVRDTADFALKGSGVKFIYSIPENIWDVEVDDAQISQVINNIVLNAKQAMPDGKRINIDLKNIKISAASDTALEQGRYVRISIKDYGMGIPDKHLDRIFDPYFTTKQNGSGLGLSTCYSIITRHNGNISVHSSLGEGTVFDIYLPATERRARKRKADPRKTLKGTGRILILDDDEEILAVTDKLLTVLGYNVTCVKNGNDAIRKYVEKMGSSESFDVVIMDLIITGGMGGKETVRRLRKIDKNIKAIVSSGYSNDPVMSNYRDFGFDAVLAKPYRLEELTNTLKELTGYPPEKYRKSK